MQKRILWLFAVLLFVSCNHQKQKDSVVLDYQTPFLWENANIYFLLTDRFADGDKTNNLNFDRTLPTAPERGFQGGDFAGIIEKLEDGYFTDLGITALWFSPIFEQIHGGVDEGTGFTYAYHGYWAKDWTSIEPNFGTEEEFAKLVEVAHEYNIRIMMDIVINHTGPITDKDPHWGDEWTRTSPTCNYKDYESTVYCSLVDNLPDIRTDNNDNVDLPSFLIEKWEAENRLEKELNSLEAFFEESNYPKAPRFYIIKWLIDYVKKYGIDGFRIDTAKHTEASIWAELAKEAKKAFAEWKLLNPELVLDDNEFYMMGEVYNYGISGGEIFDNGGKDVNYFIDGDMQSLINFEFKWDAKEMGYPELFNKYDSLLQGSMKNHSVLNYITSHDDGQPFDKARERAFEGATKLLLTPGKSQIYYGDETARNLIIENTQGDATLRGFMNWNELSENSTRSGNKVNDVLVHYQKLGKFRANNPAVGAGKHEVISLEPYVFSRTLTNEDYNNKVIISLDNNDLVKTILVGNLFKDDTILFDYYSGQEVVVKEGKVLIESDFDIVLLSKID